MYEQFGTIFLLDPRPKSAKKVPIEVEGDFTGVRPRFESAADSIVNGHISPTGARAVFEAHGEIISVPAERGDARNLMRSPGVTDRVVMLPP